MLSSRKGRVAASAALAASVVTAGIAFGAGSANAGTSTLFTVTGLSTHLVAANTANQVITLTGTGFDEALISGVTISGCSTTSGGTPTQSNETYIVTSPTTLVVKTSGDCTAGATNTITLTDTSGDTYTTNGTVAATALAFVNPPTISDTTSLHPVIEANTSLATQLDQVRTAPIGGGTTVKVFASTASGAQQFSNSTTYPLAAKLGGVPLTGIVMHTGGDYFTGVVGPHAAGAVALSVTSGGVSKTFTTAATDFAYAGSTITIAPSSGPSNGGTAVKITGTGFVPTGTGASTVKICGVDAPLSTATGVVNSATSLTVTTPQFADATVDAADAIDGPCTVKVTTGTATTIVNAGSTFTYVAQG